MKGAYIKMKILIIVLMLSLLFIAGCSHGVQKTSQESFKGIEKTAEPAETDPGEINEDLDSSDIDSLENDLDNLV